MSKPFFSWMGGKRRLAKHILPEFPNHECYVEPFCGAAALFFMKEPARCEVINDIHSELVNLYRVVQHHMEEFVHQFKYSLTSRKIFEWHKMTHPDTLTDIQRAVRFYYLQQLCFGSKVADQHFGTCTTKAPKLNLLRLEENISQAHLRLSSTYVENLEWDKCIERYDRDHTLFYCDPPYWKTAGYGGEFSFDEYIKMAEMAKNIKGKMIISINDTPEIREVFSGLRIKEVSLRHTVSGAGGKTANELIFFNF